MVALPIFLKARSFAAIASAAIAFFTITPAWANASANADILAPLRAAQASHQAAGDEEFRQLFSSWQSMDRTGSVVPSRTNLVTSVLPNRSAGVIPGFTPQTVSIPSLIPVDGAHLTSEFGMRWHPVLGGRRQHKGVDLAAAAGTPIHAAADGMVSRADWYSSYGLYVSLEHGGNFETRYGHMARLNVAAGQMVRKGDVIGYVGTTGRSTGPHLHYEVRIAGEAVNPIPYLQNGRIERAAPASVLAIAGSDEQ